MFEIDLRTLYYSFVIMLIVVLSVIALLWYQTRNRFKGLGYIVLYLFGQLAGIILIALRGIIPDFYSIIVSNFLVVGGSVLTFVGLEKFVGLRSSYFKHFVFVSVFILVHVYFTYIDPNLEIRNMNVALALFIISFLNANLLLYTVPEPMRKMTSGLGYVFVFLMFVNFVRLNKFFIVGFTDIDYFHSGGFEVYVALSYQVSYFVLTFSLIMLVNNRLLNEISVQEEKFSKAFRHSPYGIIISRIDNGEILEVNEGLELMSGYSASNLIGRTTLELKLWFDEDARNAVISDMKIFGRIKNKVMQFRRANSELFYAEFSSELILIDDVQCLLSVVNDISVQKRTEEELRKSQTMLRRFASYLQTSGEEDKAMLATQIDNELNQTLVALKMDIGLLKTRLREEQASALTEDLIVKLDEAYKVIGSSLGFSLKLMGDLRNEVLYMMGLEEGIRLYLSKCVLRCPGIACHLDVGKIDIQPSQKQSITLYRVFESAMDNVAEHSKATEVLVSMHNVGKNLELEIIDNGVGFVHNELMEHTSHGLMLMRERTALLDGEMFIVSVPGEGTTVRIVVPLS